MTELKILEKIENNEYNYKEILPMSTVISEENTAEWNKEEVRRLNKEIKEHNLPGLLVFEKDCKTFLNEQYPFFDEKECSHLLDALKIGHHLKRKISAFSSRVSRNLEIKNQAEGKLVLSEKKSVTLNLNVQAVEQMFRFKNTPSFECYTGNNLVIKLESIFKGSEEVPIEQFASEILNLAGVKTYRQPRALIDFSSHWEKSEDGFSGHDILRTRVSRIEINYLTI